MKKNARELARKPQVVTICCDVLDGLKPFAIQELRETFGKSITLLSDERSESIFAQYSGELHALLRLRTVVAVSLVEYFPVPRPRALLGHQHYQRLLRNIHLARSLHPPAAFSSFRISAAGGHSSVFSLLREKISADIALPYDADEGDLLLRVRPASLQATGWEVLTRLSPRPLSVRPWRVYNMQGALNATIAAVMVDMTEPRPDDRFLNIMCGSGTLLIERLSREAATLTVGYDIDAEVLKDAQRNIETARVAGKTLLFVSDATRLPFLPNTFNAICADLPWGQLVGSHRQNISLYPAILAETARIATPQATLVILTHEIKVFESALREFADLWELRETVKVFQGGLHPRIYVFRRKPKNWEQLT